ncbi:uncharacterized protein LOC133928725 [Phragmites australis]|uniref:uncharacterized protein LOC133928725 n=1 Tax=Phragmites australis TaxID=29695 RepID=UPI002D790C5B|nr:uncharacterized protein LOC133928725 [Phragmites australis]
MASGTKSDLVSGSPDGHGYFNAQRSPYAAASLERSGSFREGGDGYAMFPAPSSSRSTGVDSATLLHSLAVDLRTATVDHKTSRLDLKKSISSIFGTSPEDSTPTPSLGRNLSNSVEEIRRMKNNLNDNSNKARERARAFGGAVMKIERLCPNIVRKRSRGDGSSNERSGALLSGGVIPKNVPQSHLNADDVELGPQRGEERTKNAGQNRRIRTSMVEMDARTAGPSRGLGPTDRISDPGKATNGGSAVPEEKTRGLATSIDGWEKPKMKKKRSAIKADMSLVGASRTPDVDRESKQGMQHKFSNDGRARMASSSSFRSGTVASGTSKADLLSAQNGLVGRCLNRSDQDSSGFHPTNRRDRQVLLDKEMPNPRTINKPNEDDGGGNISSLPKANGSARGPRSNSGLLLKSSPNIHRLQASSDDWEHPSGTNKLISAGGSGNPKRTKSTHSLSPPTQWGGQRPQKISRSARKSNLVPIITTTDGALVSSSLDSPVNEDSPGLPRRASVNGLQQTKRGDHGPSTGSEGDEPVVAEKKLRDKSKRAGELDDGHGSGFQKIAMLGHPSKRNKLFADEDIGDAARRQGRVGRSFTPTRPGTPVSIDKLESAPTTKQRSVRTVSERNESKSGRPILKKISERKGNARPRHISSSVQSDLPVQSEDDHEELLAAANAALRSACASPLWRQVEPFFAFLTTEDVAYLSQQIHLPDDSASSRSVEGDESQKYKGGLEYISQPSTPAGSNKDDHTALPNGYGLNQLDNGIGVAWETSCIEPILDQLVHGIGVKGGASVGQRLIQALIDEDKVESITNNIYRSEGYPFDTHEIHFNGGWKSHSHDYKLEPLMNFEASVRGPNGLMMDFDWKCNNELPHKSGNIMEKAKVWPDFQYSELCFSDRIIIELSEVGVSVEPVPDLTQSEDEDINAEICKLEGQLHKEVVEKKNLLLKLDGVVRTAKESQQSEFSRRAMDRLLLRAYEKYMAFCGPNVSSSKNVNRAGRHAVLSFVKRTLARCQNYEEVGTSCFDDPIFKDLFVSVTSHRGGPDAASQDNNTIVKSVHWASASDTSRASIHLSDLSFAKEDPWTNNVKQRELLLDEVVGSITGGTLKTSGLGNPLVSNTKGKRSERDREGKGHNRDGVRSGRPSSSNAKGERKNKTKPKQKTTNISAPASSTPRDTQLPAKITPSNNGKDSTAAAARRDDPANASNDAEMPDLSNLELPGMDIDFGGWLNIDDDGLQDLDLMGLEIPMDDINEITFHLNGPP